MFTSVELQIKELLSLASRLEQEIDHVELSRDMLDKRSAPDLIIDGINEQISAMQTQLDKLYESIDYLNKFKETFENDITRIALLMFEEVSDV